jgi:dihydrolipoamide dehydrogenase
MPDRYDLVVIGGGPGGYVAAIRAAQLGKAVACVDRRAALGGTCLNVGCIPSKALLDSSELYATVKHRLGRHGIRAEGVGLDLAQMMKRKDQVVKGLTDGVAFLFKKYKVTFVHGSARLEAPGRVAVEKPGGGSATLEAGAVLLATGSEPAWPPSLTVDGKRIVTSTEALAFDTVPERLIVVGAGYIGLELGSVWSRLGSKVTVLEFLPKLLPLNDAEVVRSVQKSLTQQGLEFHLDTKVTKAVVEGGSVKVHAENQGKPQTFTGERVLVATGRRPVTAGLGLEAVGVTIDPKTGRVPVDDHFRTNVEGVYAIGDLVPGPMLAHKAMEEGIAFAEQQAGHAARVNYDTIPSVIYTWPEVAAVGLTEEQVKESGRAYRVGKFPFQANGRARCMDETEGLVKVIADQQTDRVLGVHIFGPRASDLIAEAVTTMEFAGSAEDIARIVHAHPTLSEAVGEAARVAYDGKPIHA